MRVTLEIDGIEHDVFLQREDDKLKVLVDGETYETEIGEGGSVTLGGKTHEITIETDAIVVDGTRHPFRIHDVKSGAAAGAPGAGGAARIKPPMPGKIVSVAVHEGDEVQAGDVLVILEAMKMQNEITAPAAGTVKKVHVEEGQAVEGKDVLVELE